MSGSFSGGSKKPPTLFSPLPPPLSRASTADQRAVTTTITMANLPSGIVGPKNLERNGRLGQVIEDTFSSPKYEELEQTLIKEFNNIWFKVHPYEQASIPRTVAQQLIHNTPPPLVAKIVTKTPWDRWKEKATTELNLSSLDDPVNFHIFYSHFQQPQIEKQQKKILPENLITLPENLITLYEASRSSTPSSRDSNLQKQLELAKTEFIETVMQLAHKILTLPKKNRSQEQTKILASMKGLCFPDNTQDIITTMEREIKEEQKKENEAAKKAAKAAKKHEGAEKKLIEAATAAEEEEDKKIAQELTKYLKDVKKNTDSEKILTITKNETEAITKHDYRIEPHKIKALDCVQYLYPVSLEQRVIDNLFILTGYKRMQTKHNLAKIHGVVEALKTAIDTSAAEYRRLYNGRIAASQVNDLHMIVLNMHHLTYINAAIQNQLNALKNQLNALKKDKKSVPEALISILEHLTDLNTGLLKRQVSRLKSAYTASQKPELNFVAAFNQALQNIYNEAQVPVKAMHNLHTYLQTAKLAQPIEATLQRSAEVPGTATGQYALNVKRLK